MLTQCEASGFALSRINTHNGVLLQQDTYYTQTANHALALSATTSGFYAYLYVESTLVSDSGAADTYTVATPSNVLVLFKYSDLSIISVGASAAPSPAPAQLPAWIHYSDKLYIVRHGDNANRTALHFSSSPAFPLTTTSGCPANCARCAELDPT